MFKICYGKDEVVFELEDDAVQYADELRGEGIEHRIYQKRGGKWVLIATWTPS
jgi:hypothetical protein